MHTTLYSRERDDAARNGRGGGSAMSHAAPQLGNAAMQHVLGPASGGLRLSSLTADLQRAAGNRATGALLEANRNHRETSANGEVILQRCGATSPESCDCHAETTSTSKAVQRQVGGNVAPGESGETEAVRPCSLGDRALAFTTWAIASAKLSENIPFLELVAATGLHTPHYRSKLLQHFGVPLADSATQRTMARTLADGYRQIQATMAGGINNISCGGAQCRPGDYAYVFPGTPVNIFFCDTQQSVRNLFSDPLDLASTWIHEVSHEILGTTDVGYYNHSASTSLAPAAALTNADCWGNFMVEY